MADRRTYFREYQRAYRQKNKSEILEYNRGYRKRHRPQVRLMVLVHYSNGTMCCACCHEDYEPFLVIDHILGGGRQHIERIGSGSGRIYRWLQKNNFPPGYQVLCANCNHRKSTSAACDCQAGKRCGTVAV